MLITNIKSKQIIYFTIIIFFLLKISNSYAFVGGATMGYSGGASSAGSPSIKSGISIVDPEGKSYNCEPFVDKKWESTSYEDSWNGVYFSLGYEASKFSGGIKIEDSNPSYLGIANNNPIPIFSDVGVKKSFTGSASIPLLTVGGGFLIDRMYLATDLEIRPLPFEFTRKMKVTDVSNGSNGEKKSQDYETTLTYSLKNYVFFNAKIGYLVTNRSMVYLNAGIGSFSSSNIKASGDYSVQEDNDGDSPPPIRLSLGTEFLLSNHFRLLADYSYWIVPQNMGSFNLNKKSSSNLPTRSQNSYVADFKINSLKVGILYRF